MPLQVGKGFECQVLGYESVVAPRNVALPLPEGIQEGSADTQVGCKEAPSLERHLRLYH